MLEVKHNVPAVQRWVAKVRRQIPWATAQAINQTAKDGQRFQRAYQLRAFDVTRPQWVSRAVKIKPFANKRRLWARIQIEPPGGAKRADILAKFETGGTKTPIKGTHIAIPVGPERLTKRTKAKPTIASRYGPFVHHGGKVWKGRQRTFLVRTGKRAGVYQRVRGQHQGMRSRQGKGPTVRSRSSRSHTRMLYRFVHRARIDRRLKFIVNIKRMVHKMWDRNFRKAFRQATRTAR